MKDISHSFFQNGSNYMRLCARDPLFQNLPLLIHNLECRSRHLFSSHILLGDIYLDTFVKGDKGVNGSLLIQHKFHLIAGKLRAVAVRCDLF